MNRGLLNELRNSLADVIAREKAYNVPALCARLGLEPGDESEAMRSKFRYASARMASVAGDRLVAIAKLLLEEENDFGLAELVAKASEAGTPAITELTRRRLLAEFDSESLCTEYDEIEFLETIWPIAAMPGNQNNVSFDDIGFRSLKDDIFQHMRRNDDWTNRELLERLGLMTASRALLFRFLEASVHPTAIDDGIQKARVERINAHLQHDGYRLARTGSISGSAVFTIAAHAVGSPADAAISSALQRFDPDLIHGRWSAALDRRAHDPAGAITLARTLLEDVCRWLLDELGESASDQDDLPALYRKLAKALKLAPDDHSEQVFKQILGSCQSVVESLGALRNKLGDAHGGGRKRAKPAARHAELAVNLSGSMATFLVATWDARSTASGAGSASAG
ncbi:abortive infection family protein [Sphingomonas sp. JC676]|uniref:abortive infection family protein n=1 Tax=Sphingomonas sp. JC676 TaxID=2768065 RepID=UPI0016579323|nr:abortive infection family protein [Sphingomonas sp. JC676]MBC9031824.1 abortive infection family protein [Sphingomonas sp. JC676]